MRYYNTYPTPPRRTQSTKPANLAGMWGPSAQGTSAAPASYAAPGVEKTQNLGAPWLFDNLNMDDNRWANVRMRGDVLSSGLWKRQLQNLIDEAGGYDNFRRQAITALTNPGALAGAFRGRALAGAADEGRMNAAMLRSQGIEGADAAAMLDARNRAAESSNAYERDLYSPEKMAGRAMQGMNLSSPEAILSILPILMQLSQGATAERGVRNQETAQEQDDGGMFGDLLGTGLGMLADGGLGGLLGLFGGGGKSTYQRDEGLGTWNGWGFD